MSNLNRRDLLRTAGVGLAGAAATGLVSAQNHTGHAEHVATPAAPAVAARRSTNTRAKVRTLNGWTLPYRMNDGVKEFHLVAEEFEHEFAPGSKAICWGYNGSTPGPTIEAVEGDRVRIFVT
ncbi:MAG: multicopper oxidase domain-containing protein, partial [Burkholderiaceae bacterium]|nr:multicopper oxidase domain-containing protein [Burkholderiaceae bacterium]